MKTSLTSSEKLGVGYFVGTGSAEQVEMKRRENSVVAVAVVVDDSFVWVSPCSGRGWGVPFGQLVARGSLGGFRVGGRYLFGY